jgi:pimeloyl-ACP methyl ester carboxylesterase
MPKPIAFFHANGYPTGVYRQFLDHLRQPREVMAPEIITTPLATAGPKRWAMTVASALTWLDNQPTEPLDLVGHSMGGYLAVILAHLRPERVHHVVMIDAPIVVGWRSVLLSTVQRSGRAERFGPAPIAARRKDHWPDMESAKAYFESKRFVQRWAHGVADDFYTHGLTRAADGSVRLRYAREIERDIYAYIGHRQAYAAVRAVQKLAMSPVSFIAGSLSEELRLAGVQNNKRLFGSRFHDIACGHMVPLEAPQACANLVVQVLERDA